MSQFLHHKAECKENNDDTRTITIPGYFLQKTARPKLWEERIKKNARDRIFSFTNNFLYTFEMTIKSFMLIVSKKFFLKCNQESLSKSTSTVVSCISLSKRKIKG